MLRASIAEAEKAGQRCDTLKADVEMLTVLERLANCTVSLILDGEKPQ